MRSVNGSYWTNADVFYVQVNSGPEDEVLALLAHRNLDITSTSSPHDGWRRESESLSLRNCGVFRTPSIWTLSRSGAGVGGHRGWGATAFRQHDN